MNCKYYKTRTKKGTKYGYCIKHKKEVTLYCKECNKIEYKYTLKPKRMCKIKNKTYKLTKLERNRTSIITNDLEYCYFCGMPKNDLHEIFEGSNRKNSMTYGLVIPLCRKCHTLIHNDINFIKNTQIKKLGQITFEDNYPNLDFISIFHKNYK